ncbi:MAG: EAL domain-containing protein [Lachnospiraceae bacterium]|nr:EAL domain-containing protein [Lachnospiraceae bacterium]
MILYYDVCAFIILLLVMGSCMLKRMFHGRTNGLFYLVVLTMMLATLGDFWGAYIQNFSEHTEINRNVSRIWQYLYFFSHNMLLPVYLPYIYSNIGMWHEFLRNKLLRGLWLSGIIINNLALVIDMFTHFIFDVDADLVYHRHSGIMLFYVMGAFYMLFEVIILFRYKSIIRKDKFMVMMSLYPVSLLGIIIQFFWPDHLIEMFTITIATLLFSLIIRRDEELRDPITGAGKYYVAHERIKNVLVTGAPIYILFVKLVNYRNLRLYLGEDLLSEFLRNQSRQLNVFCLYNSIEADLYYLDEGLYAFASETSDYEKVKKLGLSIKDYYLDTLDFKSFSLMIDARLCILRCPTDIDNFNTLYSFGASFHDILPPVKDVMNYPDYVNDKDFRIKSELSDIIKRALEHECFEIFYQPIYSILEDRFVAAEAFVRLRDEKYGLISPGMFISAAEISGDIHAIGDFVIEDVCRFISENDFAALGLSCIEINMSTSQCIEMNLVEKIEKLLEKYRLDPSYINLEITESAVDFDPDVVDANIDKLHEMGINFSLDDYGTGYSNVRRVTSLPLEIVKLDKTFVDGIDDPQMWIMVKETIKMLKQMGKKVLIEGVEEEAVVEKFTHLGADYIQGCEYLQGYYFCRPLPELEFLEFMREQIGKPITGVS